MIRAELFIQTELFLQAELCIQAAVCIRGKLFIQAELFIRAELFVQAELFIQAELYTRAQLFIRGELFIHAELFIRAQFFIQAELFMRNNGGCSGTTIVHGINTVYLVLYGVVWCCMVLYVVAWGCSIQTQHLFTLLSWNLKHTSFRKRSQGSLWPANDYIPTYLTTHLRLNLRKLYDKALCDIISLSSNSWSMQFRGFMYCFFASWSILPICFITTVTI